MKPWDPRALPLLAGLALAISTTAIRAQTNSEASRDLGIEGALTLTLPRPDYRPRPLDDRTELILRIESVKAAGSGGHTYEFRYLGLEPGAYALADFLVRPDGTRPDELTNVLLQVRTHLPEDHDGQLNLFLPGRFPFIGGYRVFLGVLGVAWVAGLVGIAWSFRKRKALVETVAAPHEPSLAELLRPLVEAAAEGKLSTDGQALLERYLMGYWRERLHLPEMRMAEALQRLKEHGEAGALLRAVERWLHQPVKTTESEIRSLLEPYRRIPAPQVVEGGNA